MLTAIRRNSENILAARRIGKRTIISQCLARPPVRLVQANAGDSALVFITTFGGGLLEGDDFHYTVDCGPEARLALLPQSNTRIFPCPKGEITKQCMRGTVFPGALVASGGDPVVLYAGSRYAQSQHWVLHPGGRLLLMEWLVAGRLERGERFAFEECRLETKVTDVDGKPLLLDRMQLNARDSADRGWGGFASYFTVHVLGPGVENLGVSMQAWMKDKWNTGGVLAGLGMRPGLGFSVRALGADRTALDPLAAAVFAAVGGSDWLDFDPWKRKY